MLRPPAGRRRVDIDVDLFPNVPVYVARGVE